MGAPKPPKAVRQRKTKNNRQDHPAAKSEPVDAPRNDGLYDFSTSDLEDAKGSMEAKKYVGKHGNLLGLPYEAEARSAAILESKKARSEHTHAVSTAKEAPKPPKPMRQKKPKFARQDYSLNDIKPAPNEFRNCMCDLINIAVDDGFPMANMELCGKHMLMGKPREAAKRSTVIVDLEDSEPEQTYASFRAVEVPRLPKPVKHKKPKKKRPLYPDPGNKATPMLWDDCVCDLLSDNDLQTKTWTYCTERDLLLGVPCSAMKLSDNVVDLEESDPEPSGERYLVSKNLLGSVSGRVKDKKEAQGKKRKFEANSGLVDVQGHGADLSRGGKPSGPAASLPTRLAYDRRTLASDILRATGRHPTLPPLNWQLIQRGDRA